MTLRAASLLLLIYALGFALFAVALGRPAGKERTDAIVVLTGGSGRIERGMEMLGEGRARHMLIAGADPSVTKADLVRRLGGERRLIRCCVDLGSESVDTRSNAEEAYRWIERRKAKSFRLITSDWHMRRASYEFARQFDGKVRIVRDAVPSRPPLHTLFLEYNKYLLRRAAVWMDF